MQLFFLLMHVCLCSVEFTIRNNKGQEIAKGSSPPILITDDHKSTRHKGRKRSRASMVADTTTSSSTDDLSDKGTFTPPACITPRRISYGGPSSSSSSPSTASSVNSFFDFMVPGSLPTPKGDDEKMNHRHSNSRRTSCSFFGDVSPMTTTAATGKSLIPTLMATRHHSENSSNPQVDRLVPSQGPIYGGVEVTILGSGFYQGLTCFFGEHEAETIYWNPNTLVCVLPPNAHPGPVVVTFKSHSLVLEGHDVPLFTYHDANEQALLELALQVVGLKMTGKLHDAKHIAMKIVQGSGNNNNGNGSLFPSSSAISSSLLTSS